MELMSRQLVAKIVFLIGVSFSSSLVFASVIYSGEQNIVFTAPSNGQLTAGFDLAGDTSSDWDNIQFYLGGSGAGRSYGYSLTWSGAPVALAYESNFPNVELYQNGQAMTGQFGSGALPLWYIDVVNGFNLGAFQDVTGFAGVMLNSFGDSPLYGWIQLSVSNAGNFDGAGSVLTIIDWAYETSGARIEIGSGAVPVPESSAFILMLIGLAGCFVIRSSKIRL